MELFAFFVCIPIAVAAVSECFGTWPVHSAATGYNSLKENKMDSEVLQAYFVIVVVTIVVFTASFCAAMKLGDMVARVMCWFQIRKRDRVV
jgi:hypothetical protein